MPHKFHLSNDYWQENLQFDDLALIQLGIMHCSAGDVVEEHLHGHFYELTVVVQGEGVISTNGEEVAVGENDVHFAYPLETHKIRSSEEKPLHFLFCSFKTVSPSFNRELMKISEKHKSAASRVFRSSTLVKQVELALEQVKKTEQPFYREYMRAILTEILITTVRGFQSDGQGETKISQAQEFCYQVMAYVNENIFDLSSPAQVADEFSYNYCHISRVFKKGTGQNLSDYFRTIRLQTAKSLIEKAYRFTEISELLHFASLYSFSKSFKEFYGCSPTEYKKKVFERRQS